MEISTDEKRQDRHYLCTCIYYADLCSFGSGLGGRGRELKGKMREGWEMAVQREDSEAQPRSDGGDTPRTDGK